MLSCPCDSLLAVLFPRVRAQVLGFEHTKRCSMRAFVLYVLWSF
jgi:hypothetical protein